MLPDTIRNIIAVGAGSFIGGIIGLLWGFASYIALSVLAGIALVALGYYIAR